MPLADGTMLRARTVRWHSLDGFARIEGPHLPEPALLSGEIRYFLRIDGVLGDASWST